MIPIRTAVYGVNGKMGQLLSKHIALSEDFEMAFGVDKDPMKIDNTFPVYKDPFEYEGTLDLIIDFSHSSNLENLLKYATSKSIATVIATTGLDETHVSLIKESSKKIPILYSPNMSLGVNIMNSILKHYSKMLNDGFDIEIIEKHHNKKIDAPSGTAYLLAETINTALEGQMRFTYGRHGTDCQRVPDEIGIHTVRGGSISGEHTVIFAGDQEIIEIKHTALSKDLFAHDALRASRIFINKEPGYYTMADIYNL
jgi:4-hydroxy-tetrahydrodipicolinate reductase